MRNRHEPNKMRDKDVIRFWRKVEKGDGCWDWQASCDGSGYGQFHLQDKLVKAHRVSWFMAHGDWPGDMCVLHTCDNPRCVRPDHLFLGTHADNMRDKVRKGRGVSQRGEASHFAKLREPDVLRILDLLKIGRSQQSIADEYGVHRTTIEHIGRGRRWAHLSDMKEGLIDPELDELDGLLLALADLSGGER